MRGKFVEECVGAGEMIRHDADGAIDFFDRLAGIRIDLLVRGGDEVSGAYERLFEVGGIVNHDGDGEVIAVAHDVRADGGVGAARDAVAANPAFFQMIGDDGQRVAFPFAGGETLPGVASVVGRVGAAVHPDGLLGDCQEMCVR